MANAIHNPAERSAKNPAQAAPALASTEHGTLLQPETLPSIAASGDPTGVVSRHAAVLRDPRLRAAGEVQRIRMVQHLQRGHGNSYVARVIAQAQHADKQLPTAVAELKPEAQVDQEKHEAQKETDTFSPREVERPSEQATVQRGFLDAIANPRQAVLGKMGEFAKNIPGYSMLTLAIGHDPISDQPVDRSPMNVFRAVLGLVPGGNAIFENLNESGAIDKAFTWLNEQFTTLGLSFDAIKALFKRAWDALSMTDLLNPLGAWEKLKTIFMGPITRLKNFVVSIGEKVMEFIFEGVLEKLGGGQVLGLIKRAGGAFQQIIKDPIGFLGNLITGVKQGLSGFVGNIGTHLKKGLMGWLFGELAAGGIELPKSFDLKGILGLVMQVLGMTWTAIRSQAAKTLGEPVVSKLEGAFSIFKVIKDQGIGGLWDFIKEQVGNLKEMVIGGVKDLVTSQVVQAGIQWLMGILGGPAGAIVKAIKAVYDIVVWFMNNASRMMALVNSVVDSIGAIASGAVANAARFIEQSLANAIPMALGFLASLLGLGNLSSKIRAIIEKVQQPVKKAVGWVLGKARAFATKIMGRVKGAIAGKSRSEAEKQKALKQGMDAGVAAINRFKGKRFGVLLLKPILSVIKFKHKLSVLEPLKGPKYWAVQGDIQRMEKQDSEVHSDDKDKKPIEEQAEANGVLKITGVLLVEKTKLNEEGKLHKNFAPEIDSYNQALVSLNAQWSSASATINDSSMYELAREEFSVIKKDAKNLYDNAVKSLPNKGSVEPTENTEKKKVLKSESLVWKDLQNHRGKTKKNGSGANTLYYEWDHTHSDIEVYNSTGKHLGSMDAVTGAMYKPPVNGRTFEK